MSELDDLFTALQNADAKAEAGDMQAREDAKQLAQMIQQMQSQTPAPPTSPQPDSPPPTDSGGPGSIADALGQGAMLGFSDEIAGALGAGVNSVAKLFGGGVDQSFGEFYRGARDNARFNAQQYAKRNPGTALAAEIGGGLLSGGVGAARAGLLSGGAQLGKLAGTGAAQGATYGLGASQGDLKTQLTDAAKGAAAGGVTAAAAPSLLRGAGKVGKKLLGIEPLDRVARESIDLVERAGVKLSAAQKSGSAAVGQLEGTMKDVPLIGTPLAQLRDEQRIQFQRALMERSGFVADDLEDALITTEGIERAKNSFTDKYLDKLRGTNVALGPRFTRKLDQVREQFNTSLAGAVNSDVRKIITAVKRRSARGNLTGHAYQKLRSELSSLERQFRNDPRKQMLYGDIKKTLDTAFRNAAGETKSAQLKKLNNEYAHLKQIERLNLASAGGTGGFAGGMMPIDRIARLAQQSAGSKEWKKLTRAGQAVLIDGVPNSGTAQRAAALSGSLGFLGALAGGNLGAAAGVAGTAGAGNLLSRALANPGASGAMAQGAGRQITNAGLLSAAPVSGLLSASPPTPGEVPPLLQRPGG